MEKLLESSWFKETSADPKNWNIFNPAWGQCAVTALVVQDFFGGELLRAVAKSKKGNSVSHYWNLLPDNQEIDLTMKQFSDDTSLENEEKRDRKYVLSFLQTRKRYSLLRLAIENKISENPIFKNEIFKECFETAQDSECKKMKFACLVLYKGKFIVKAFNKTIEPLRKLCDPDCIRFKIQSRTESMIGACGHAEEWALWETARLKVSLDDCIFYIAGFDGKTNKSWIKSKVEHTCLRCAAQMHMAKVGKIYVPVNGDWESITADEAVKTALAYAMKEKTV